LIVSGRQVPKTRFGNQLLKEKDMAVGPFAGA
jgi:hypothetical protein